MTTRNDLDRLLVTFLEDGETELPDSALQSVRAGIDRTRQRVVIGPWREPAMPNLTRTVAVLAAAVVILAIGVFSLSGLPVAPSGPPSVAAPPTPSTAPSATSAAESPAIPAYPAYRWPQALAPGDYSTSMAWDLPFEIRFTVPAGWESRDVEVVKGPAFVSVQVVRNTFADPCLGIEADPAVGPGVDDLAAALVLDNPAIVATQATPVELGGRSAATLSYEPAADVDCVGEASQLWALPADLMLPIGPLGPPSFPLRAEAHLVWIIDVDGTRLVIDASAGPDPTPELRAEVQSIVDSIGFGSLTQTIAVGSCTLDVTGQEAGEDPPYRVTLGPGVPTELNGPIPAPFPLAGPLAWMDFRGEGWQAARGEPGGFRMIPPPGAATTGFTTTTNVGGYQGSWVFDAPGTWWIKFTGDRSGCVRQFPVIVAPMPAPS